MDEQQREELDAARIDGAAAIDYVRLLMQHADGVNAHALADDAVQHHAGDPAAKLRMLGAIDFKRRTVTVGRVRRPLVRRVLRAPRTPRARRPRSTVRRASRVASRGEPQPEPPPPLEAATR